MSDEILVAKESFSTEINGTPRVVTKGETFREGHSVIEGREEMFEPFKVDNELEQATAAPGEKRRQRRQKKTEPEKSEAGEEKQATAAPGEGKPASTTDSDQTGASKDKS
jgi:hypothetical protein